MPSPSRPTFHYAEIQGSRGEQTVYVLDNNVVAIVEGMLRSGTLDKNPKRDMVQDLIDRLVAKPSSHCVDDFALLEATQFADPLGLRCDTLVLRDAAYEVIKQSPKDLYASVAGVQGFGFPAGYDDAFREQVAGTIASLPTTFVPAYVAALVLEKRLGAGSHRELSEDDVLAVLRTLSTGLGFVPATLWLTLLVASCGSDRARQQAMGVLKTGRKDRKHKKYDARKNALSAAWDLASLQLASEKYVHNTHTVVVTEDKPFADLIGHFQFEFGGLRLDQSAIDPKREPVLDHLMQAYQKDRMGREPSRPTRERSADLIQECERRLGTPSGVPTQLRSGPVLRRLEEDFWVRDVQVISDLLLAETSDDLEDALSAVFALHQVDDLKSLLHGSIRAGALAATTFADWFGMATQDVVKGQLECLGEAPPDYALTLLDYLEAEVRPLQAAARYAFLTRADLLQRHARLQAAAVRCLVRAWAGAAGVRGEEFLQKVLAELPALSAP
ncbi:hypothetical protein [Nocardioides pantholopis]|uniref:hypothetical protein n=1 Tax=Nocardioides pantholopis TaxID=2483798 RepID=UPI000FD6DE81|nr:hypothetical protein [Nocardioides pantholopis]